MSWIHVFVVSLPYADVRILRIGPGSALYSQPMLLVTVFLQILPSTITRGPGCQDVPASFRDGKALSVAISDADCWFYAGRGCDWQTGQGRHW